MLRHQRLSNFPRDKRETKGKKERCCRKTFFAPFCAGRLTTYLFKSGPNCLSVPLDARLFLLRESCAVKSCWILELSRPICLGKWHTLAVAGDLTDKGQIEGKHVNWRNERRGDNGIIKHGYETSTCLASPLQRESQGTFFIALSSGQYL